MLEGLHGEDSIAERGWADGQVRVLTVNEANSSGRGGETNAPAR